MEDIIYKINKGVNRPIEFRGLKAQYIYYLAVGLAVLLVLFCIVYIGGMPVYLSLFLILVLGVGLFVAVSRLNRHFGEFGLMKRCAHRHLPKGIRSTSTMIFRSMSSHK